MRFRLVPKSVTLNNLERRIQGLPKVFKYVLKGHENVWVKGSVGVSRRCPKSLSTPYSIPPGTGKATDFKFGWYIYGVYSNKSALKFCRKERGRIKVLPKVLKYHLLSQERVKLYELQILLVLSCDRLQQKPINNFWKSSRGRSQGLPKFFRASIHTHSLR